jgi:hypothetical protein
MSNKIDTFKMYETAMLFERLKEYFGKYEISFQFWGDGNNNVFINKDDVEIASFGGENTPEEIMVRALEYLDRINRKPTYAIDKTKKQ